MDVHKSNQARIRKVNGRTSTAFGGRPPANRVSEPHYRRGDNGRFFRELGIANDETENRDERLRAMHWLARRIHNPRRLRIMLAEKFRGAGESLWLGEVMFVVRPQLPFSNAELARMLPCDETGIRRAVRRSDFVDAKSSSVIATMLQRTQFPQGRLPEFPSDEHVSVAGLCWIAPVLKGVLEERRDGNCRAASTSSVKFGSGFLLNTVVRHPNVWLAAPYSPNLRPTATELSSNLRLIDTLEECAAKANAAMRADPLIVEMFGELRLADLITDFAACLPYLESWFYARELMLPGTITDEGDLLGIF